MALYTIQPFDTSMGDKWDRFVLEQSANGTFLQTRNFLNYHPKGRFNDASLVFLKGNEIIAVIPGNIIEDASKRSFVSHGGSTFGGIVIHKDYLKVAIMEELFDALHEVFQKNEITEAVLKQSSELYSRKGSELLDYYLFNRGFSPSYEIGYYVDFSSYSKDIPSNFVASARRDYRYSLKNDLSFRELFDDDQIGEFYSVLCDNYKKFGHPPVHTLEDLLDFKRNRLKDIVRFFGVYYQGNMISGSMVFDFEKKVFHTQYLAAKLDIGELHANSFLYTNLITTASDERYPYLSFGTSTLDGGRTLNFFLAQFKEKFGTKQYINKTYSKRFS